MILIKNMSSTFHTVTFKKMVSVWACGERQTVNFWETVREELTFYTKTIQTG